MTVPFYKRYMFNFENITNTKNSEETNMSKETVMAFVMKGMFRNQTRYKEAWEKISAYEFDFIDDVASLVAFDLAAYLDREVEGVDAEEKCSQVYEPVGHIIIEYVHKIDQLPEEEDWQLIFATLKAKAENRQVVLDILNQPPLPKTIGELKGATPKLGDKVALSAMGKSKYHDTPMTPHNADGRVTKVELERQNIDTPALYYVVWATGSINNFFAEELVVVS